MLVGNLIYTWMAHRLARESGRTDVTAMPLGLDAPTSIGMALLVLGPAFVAFKQQGMDEAAAATATWQLGMASLVVMGVLKLVLSFFGDAITRAVPRAALLGSIGGAALALLGFLPLIETLRSPVVGFVTFGLLMYVLVAKGKLPIRMPGVLLAFIVGTVLYYGLGLAGLGTPGFKLPDAAPLRFTLPLPTLGFLDGLPYTVPYLPLLLPFGLLMVVGGINVSESARAAGDDYRTRDVLLAEAISTLVAGFRGGVAQTTPYIGQPAYKHMGARMGYTLLTGLFIGLGGIFGYVSGPVQRLPIAVLAPIIVYVGMDITVQAFTCCALRMGLAGVGVGFVSGADLDAGGGPPSTHPSGHGTSVAELRGPTEPSPGGQVRRYEFTARKTTVTLPSGRTVEAWGFNGQVPGPPITERKGDLIEVTLRNADIERGVTLHWHGYDVPAGEDGAPGVTQDAVLPGASFVYRFRADQVGTYWYHTHQVSDRGVKMGLYGTLVVGAPPPGLDLSLPVHTFGGSTVLGASSQPVAAGTPVRLRLINTDSTPHRFTLAGTPYRLVAVDGYDLNGPGELTSVGLRLPAGGRYDLSFTMPATPVALRVDSADGLFLGGTSAVDTSDWPELDLTRYGTPAQTPFGPDSRFDRRFTLVLDRGVAMVDGRPRYAHTVNGRGFPSIPTQLVRRNDLVETTVVNRGLDTHPWHLHGHRVLVLERDGSPVTGSPLWLDTFDVRPGEVWRVAFRAANPGEWMNHCHNLSHAELGMALHLRYEGVTTPFHGGHGG